MIFQPNVVAFTISLNRARVTSHSLSSTLSFPSRLSTSDGQRDNRVSSRSPHQGLTNLAVHIRTDRAEAG